MVPLITQQETHLAATNQSVVTNALCSPGWSPGNISCPIHAAARMLKIWLLCLLPCPLSSSEPWLICITSEQQLSPLWGYHHITPVSEGQTKYFSTFRDSFLLDFTVKTPARVGSVCENCNDIVNTSNEMYQVLIF